MNRLFCYLLLLCCASAAADRPPPAGHYAEPATIKFAAHVFPPFQYKRNGVEAGPFIKIMHAVCKEAGVRCEFVMGAFKDVYPMAIAGEADGIFSFLLDHDEERNEQFLLSPAIVNTSYSFFTTSTSNWRWTGKPEDLAGRTVGVYGPSGTELVAHRVVLMNPSAKLVVEASNLQVFQQLIVGKYGPKAAIVANKDVGLAFLKTSNIYGPKPAGDITDAVFGFGISRKSPNAAYANALFSAVNKLKLNGTISRLLRDNDPPLSMSPLE